MKGRFLCTPQDPALGGKFLINWIHMIAFPIKRDIIKYSKSRESINELSPKDRRMTAVLMNRVAHVVRTCAQIRSLEL